MPVSEIRDLLGQIEGVLSVVVQEGPAGEIEELAIAVGPGVEERRMVRDVESALMSGLGMRIDHKVIEIHQLSGGQGVSATRTDAGARRDIDTMVAKSLQARFLLDSDHFDERIRLEQVRCHPDGELYCEVTVELELDGDRIQRSLREADTRRGRVLAAGRAAVNAVADLLEEEVAIVLEGVEEIRLGDTTGLLTQVRVRQGRAQQEFYGATIVAGDPPLAAARAVLDALNRFLEARERNHPGKESDHGGRFLTA